MYFWFPTDYIDFLDLGLTNNVKQTFLSNGDEMSDPIEVPNGFAFGNTTSSVLYVSYIAKIEIIDSLHLTSGLYIGKRAINIFTRLQKKTSYNLFIHALNLITRRHVTLVVLAYYLYCKELIVIVPMYLCTASSVIGWS